MKLREFNFNSIPVRGLSIFVDGKEIAMGFIGEVLRKIPIECADYEIESTNYFFDVFVIRLKSEADKHGS
jgi:hypothetical protein